MPDDRIPPSRPPAPPPARPGSPMLPLRRASRRVLVVDDSPTVRTLVGEMLGRMGYRAPDVAFADSAASAMDAFEAKHPGVVLLDLELGDAPGSELATKLLERDPTTRIVLMTGYDEQQEEVRRVVRMGAFAYLGKPLRFQALARVLDQIDAEESHRGRIR